MKRAQKKFERDPRKIFFLRTKPYGLVKARNCEQSSQFNNNNNNKTTMPPIEVIANCELCVTKKQYISHVDQLFKNWSNRF